MSVEFQLKLEPPKEETPQLDLFQENTEEIPVHLLLDDDPQNEIQEWRRRALFLGSIFIHIFLIILIIFAPDLIRRGKVMMGIPVAPKPKNEITTLFLPPDLLKSLQHPPPEAKLSDKNRMAQGKSPIIDPHGLKMPYSKGNTPEPEKLRGGPAPQVAPPQPPAAAPPPGGQQAPQQIQQQPPPKPAPKEQAQLQLEDVPSPSSNPNKFQVP